jgi:hypothetical protein
LLEAVAATLAIAALTATGFSACPAWTAASEDGRSLVLVERGDNLARYIEEAARRFGSQQVTSMFTVTSIRFVNDHQANLTYTIEVSGAQSIRLPDRIGQAINTDEGWKVARSTFCELTHMAGVQCPPQP